MLDKAAYGVITVIMIWREGKRKLARGALGQGEVAGVRCVCRKGYFTG